MAQKATNREILIAYQKHKSVWLAAEELGMCGQSVHERLQKLKVTIDGNGQPWTDADQEKLIAFYSAGFLRADGTLDEFCNSMKRTKQFISRKAHELGLSCSTRRISETERFIMGQRAAQYIKENGHPRGSLGMKHTPETKAKISVQSLEGWKKRTQEETAAMMLKGAKTREANGILYKERQGTSWKAAWHEIGGKRKYFRSKWESNYARYLEWLKQVKEIKEWEHEPETFWFDKIKRGTCSYLPDFRVTEKNGAVVYHEVKGWMDDRSKTKIRRMKKYYPKIKLIVIDSKKYKELSRQVSGLVPGWES